MNTQIVDHRRSIPISYGNMAKINPFNKKKDLNIVNEVPLKRKVYIPTSSREFGKEINIPSVLTTHNNQEVFNSRKSYWIPIDRKTKKETQNSKKKNNESIISKKTIKQNFNSLHKKTTVTSVRYYSSKQTKEKSKKISKSKHKALSKRSIFQPYHNLTINEDVVMKDENVNPNSITKRYNNSLTLHNIHNVKNSIHEEIEIKPQITHEKKLENIQCADEYFDDICSELFNNEEKYLVNPDYMSNQVDINQRMRAILIDWLIDVHLKYKLVPQTMYIAVNLIDRYLEKNETNRKNLQLVGVTAMFIACKYEEIYPPELKDFVYITDGAYVKSDVLEMEYKMLKSLDFNITFPTQWSIFEIYKKKIGLNERTVKLAWFLMELCLIDYKSLKFKMSHLAASAILIASKTLGDYQSYWFSNIIGIEEKQLEKCCREIVDFYIYNSTHNLQAIRKKFASIKYGEVSKIKIC